MDFRFGTLLKREIDLIDINDENVNNLIKIEALNSRFVIISDNLLEEARNHYDKLAKENIVWRRKRLKLLKSLR